MAFNRPTQGRVLADDRDLTDLRLAEYRRHLGVVLQDNFLFDGTVADNIKYGTPEATRADVQRVAQIANADEFIQKFGKGYDTNVNDRVGCRVVSTSAVAIARHSRGSAHPAARRGHREPRQRARCDSGRPAIAPQGPHHVRHRSCRPFAPIRFW
jgi:hypothetical protein